MRITLRQLQIECTKDDVMLTALFTANYEMKYTVVLLLRDTNKWKYYTFIQHSFMDSTVHYET